MKYLIFLAVIIIGVNALQFDVHPGEKRCFFEDFSKGEYIYGRYRIPTIPVMMMTIKIFSPAKDAPVWANADATEGDYMFSADVDGLYMFCFSDKERKGISDNRKPDTRRVSFTLIESWTLPDSKEDEDTIQVDELRPVENYLESIERKINFLTRELQEFRAREARHRDTSESTQWRISSFSTATVFILIIFGALQMVYLKSFFKKKKLL